LACLRPKGFASSDPADGMRYLSIFQQQQQVYFDSVGFV